MAVTILAWVVDFDFDFNFDAHSLAMVVDRHLTCPCL